MAVSLATLIARKFPTKERDYQQEFLVQIELVGCYVLELKPTCGHSMGLCAMISWSYLHSLDLKPCFL